MTVIQAVVLQRPTDTPWTWLQLHFHRPKTSLPYAFHSLWLVANQRGLYIPQWLRIQVLIRHNGKSACASLDDEKTKIQWFMFSSSAQTFSSEFKSTEACPLGQCFALTLAETKKAVGQSGHLSQALQGSRKSRSLSKPQATHLQPDNSSSKLHPKIEGMGTIFSHLLLCKNVTTFGELNFLFSMSCLPNTSFLMKLKLYIIALWDIIRFPWTSSIRLSDFPKYHNCRSLEQSCSNSTMCPWTPGIFIYHVHLILMPHSLK